MSLDRRRLNIVLIILSLVLGVWAVWIYRRPSSVYLAPQTIIADTPAPAAASDTADVTIREADIEIAGSLSEGETPQETQAKEVRHYPVISTKFQDADIIMMTGSHPFRSEAQKVLSGNLEENDSLSRRKILSYCEHLRTSYTTRDIDFLRQVFSNDALIIVGLVVKTGESSDRTMSGNSKVRYSVRSKQEYLSNLTRIFDSGKDIDVRFSGFRILRHPTMEGIYGVTLRQEYSCGTYSDDGYLFLLWDFRDPSMPLIHVRTWQPARYVGENGDDIIDMSDFNLE